MRAIFHEQELQLFDEAQAPDVKESKRCKIVGAGEEKHTAGDAGSRRASAWVSRARLIIRADQRRGELGGTGSARAQTGIIGIRCPEAAWVSVIKPHAPGFGAAPAPEDAHLARSPRRR